MRVLLEKQNPIIPAKYSSENTPDSVFDLLSNYLFSNLLTANQEQDTDGQTKINSEDASAAHANAEDVLSCPSSVSPLTQFMTEMIQSSIQQVQTKNNLNEDQNKSLAEDKQMQDPLATELAVTEAKLQKKVTPSVNESAQSGAASILSDDEETEIDNEVMKMTSEMKGRENFEKLTPSFQKLTSESENKTEYINVHERSQPVSSPANVVDSVKEAKGSDAFKVSADDQKNNLKQRIDAWLTHINYAEQSNLQAGSLDEVRSRPANPSTASTFAGEKSAPTTTAQKTEHPLSFQLDKIEQSQRDLDSYHLNIRINPPELGPITARLKVNKNKVELNIMTNNAQVEQVVKAHLATLTEQFNQSSMQLENVWVNHSDLAGQQYENPAPHTQQYDQEIQKVNTPQTQVADKTKKTSDALIDAYI